MITIISPAKSMDTSTSECILATSTPRFIDQANTLALKMSEYSKEEIKELFKVSDTIAESTYQRYQHFNSDDTSVAPAIFAYTGSVFKVMSPKSFTKDDLIFANSHLLIVSVLYGLLSPLDMIKAYRLEYKTKVGNIGGNLYHFWKQHLTTSLVDIAKASTGVVVNLSSLDVLPALQIDILNQELVVITPEFKTLKDGECRTIQTHSKMARGAMSQFIVKNRVLTPEGLKTFNWGGYSFDEALSTFDRYLFIKQ